MIADALIGTALRKFYPDTPENFGPEDMVHSYGRTWEALLYSLLFMPALVEVEGSVLLAQYASDDEAKERFRSGLREKEWNREELEASFNCMEVLYVFGGFEPQVVYYEYELLAEQLARAWKGHLAVSYPDRMFVVRVVPPEEVGGGISVEFFESR